MLQLQLPYRLRPWDIVYPKGALEQMDAYHHQAHPCGYLLVIAADASRQGRGLGSALMKHALERCDREGAQAYLETANSANISLYERHGFEVVGRIDVGSAPTIRPMIRVCGEKVGQLHQMAVDIQDAPLTRIAHAVAISCGPGDEHCGPHAGRQRETP
jgi:predicted GNAT family acetyltransferase